MMPVSKSCGASSTSRRLSPFDRDFRFASSSRAISCSSHIGVEMTKLKLGPIVDEKPVKVTVELPASLHRDLSVYAEALGREQGQTIVDPARLIVPMIQRFMATDRGNPRG